MQTLLGGISSPDESRFAEALDAIRMAMLESLGPTGGSENGAVQLRVNYATDLQDLWYLRGDVMVAIAAADGEAVAKRKLQDITNMFKGLLPRGLSSRPSPLGD
jgi:hypothetical protein